jgi:hypothetical protein
MSARAILTVLAGAALMLGALWLAIVILKAVGISLFWPSWWPSWMPR